MGGARAPSALWYIATPMVTVAGTTNGHFRLSGPQPPINVTADDHNATTASGVGDSN